MKLLMLCLFFLTGCASNSKTLTRYEIMEQLWSGQSNKNQVINKLGGDFENVDNGIVYRESPNKFISGHFFDSNNKIREQFIFLSIPELNMLKKQLSCGWVEKEKRESSPHSSQLVLSGKCKERDISYQYRTSMALFEVRWKK